MCILGDRLQPQEKNKKLTTASLQEDGDDILHSSGYYLRICAIV